MTAEDLLIEAAILEADKKLDDGLECVDGVLQHPHLRTQGLAWFLKGSICHSRKDYDQAIDCYRKVLDSPDFDTPGDAWNNMGLAYNGKEEFDQAINCFRKALDSSGYDTPGMTWINMGLAYHGKKEFDQAIDCYRRALDSPGFDTAGLAWYNMGNAYREKKDFDQAIDCYRKALDSPGYDTPGKAWSNMGVAYSDKKEFDQAIDCYRRAVDSPDFDTAGLAWNNMGVAYSDKKEFDQAIDCYRRALDSPGFDTAGLAWYNMGNAYREKKDFDQAVDCYRKALDSPGYDTPGKAWNNMGNAYRAKMEFDQAIDCYRKALDSPGFDAPGRAWNNMGNAYSDKKEFDQAIDCFLKALASPGYDTPGRAWFDMGNAHNDKKEFDQAIDCYLKALASPDYDTPGGAWYNIGIAHAGKKEYAAAIGDWKKAIPLFEEKGESEWVEITKAKIAAIRVPPDQRSKKDSAILESPATSTSGSERSESPEDRIKAKIMRVETDAYERYGSVPSSGLTDVLSILRGWGSAVSLVASPEAPCRGGGYFLKWRDKGLVIDPGFDFLQNFRQARFHCREINAVVVSHNHPDHNQDLLPLDVIRYEMHKRADGADNKEQWHYVLVWDKDTADNKQFDPEHGDYRQPAPRVLDTSLQGWHTPMLADLFSGAGLPFRIYYFPVKHADDVKHCTGLKVECLTPEGKCAVRVGFSCDTGFFPDLCRKDYLGDSDILIAHISEPDPKEYDDADCLKTGHLGYRGLQRLVTGCKPKLTIVSEFWAGLADLRIDLVQGLRKLCKTQAILPGSIGLFVKPDTRQIRCTNCGAWINWDQIATGSPSLAFGPLNYLCPNWRV